MARKSLYCTEGMALPLLVVVHQLAPNFDLIILYSVLHLRGSLFVGEIQKILAIKMFLAKCIYYLYNSVRS